MSVLRQEVGRREVGQRLWEEEGELDVCDPWQTQDRGEGSPVTDHLQEK